MQIKIMIANLCLAVTLDDDDEDDEESKQENTND